MIIHLSIATALLRIRIGVADSGYSCGYHTGVDIAEYGTTEDNPWLYPVKEGTVVYINKTTDVSLGVQCQIRDNDGRYWRYCHMVAGTLQVSVGDKVTYDTKIGRMGATGNVTGVHLHLEYSSTQAWQCSSFLNPCTELGIPNVDNTVIKYSGESPTPTPTPTPVEKKKTKFKWVLYSRKLRNRRKRLDKFRY